MVVGDPIINKSSTESWQFETDTGTKLELPAHKCQNVIKLSRRARNIKLRIEHVARGKDSYGPVSVKYMAADGRELLPTGQLSQHDVHGPYFLLKGSLDSSVSEEVLLNIPSEAESVAIQGLYWGDHTPNIVGDIEAEVMFEREISIEEFIASIPHDEQLFVVDSAAPPMGDEA